MSQPSETTSSARSRLALATLHSAERQAFELYKSYAVVYPELWIKFLQEAIIDPSIQFALNVRKLHEISGIKYNKNDKIKFSRKFDGPDVGFENSYSESLNRIIHCRTARPILIDSPDKPWPGTRNIQIVGLEVGNEQGQLRRIDVIGMAMTFLGELVPLVVANLDNDKSAIH